MVAASKEEKDAKAEQDRLAKAAEEDAERARIAANSASVADAQAKAENELREQIRAEERAKLTAEVQGDSVEGFGGQTVATDNYAAVTTERVGRQIVELRPAAWVGEGFIIPATRVKEVAKLLGQVRNLPEQD